MTCQRCGHVAVVDDPAPQLRHQRLAGRRYRCQECGAIGLPSLGTLGGGDRCGKAGGEKPSSGGRPPQRRRPSTSRFSAWTSGQLGDDKSCFTQAAENSDSLEIAMTWRSDPSNERAPSRRLARCRPRKCLLLPHRLAITASGPISNSQVHWLRSTAASLISPTYRRRQVVRPIPPRGGEGPTLVVVEQTVRGPQFFGPQWDQVESHNLIPFGSQPAVLIWNVILVPITWEANVWMTGPALGAPRFPTRGHHVRPNRRLRFLLHA